MYIYFLRKFLIILKKIEKISIYFFLYFFKKCLFTRFYAIRHKTKKSSLKKLLILTINKFFIKTIFLKLQNNIYVLTIYVNSSLQLSVSKDFKNCSSLFIQISPFISKIIILSFSLIFPSKNSFTILSCI